MTVTHNWNYFNGGLHGWNGLNGYVPPEPMTACYCAECGPKLIPGFGVKYPQAGREHWDTGFRSAPWKIGKPCDGCGKDI